MSATNVAIVDDSDPSVHYAGSWGKSGARQEFQTTTSYSATQGSTASLTFTGTSIGVYGTLGPVSGASDTTMSFVVDNSQSLSGSFTAPSNLSAAIHHNNFWQSPPLTDSEHTLVVTMTETQANVILFLDYFMFTTTSTSVGAYFIDDRDPRVSYKPSWTSQSLEQYFQNTAQQSTSKGDSFTLTFEGTSVQYYGDITDGNVTAQMSVDGGPVTHFSLTALPASTLNVLMYSSGQLPSGNHTLLVTAENNFPLWVDYFLVSPPSPSSPASISSAGSVSSSSAAPPPPTQTQSSKSKTPVGAIASGVFGGVALIAAVIFASFCLQRRRRRRRDQVDIDSAPPAAFVPQSGAPIHAAYNTTGPTHVSNHATAATSTSMLLSSHSAQEEPTPYQHFDPYSTPSQQSPSTRISPAAESAFGGTSSDTSSSAPAGSLPLRSVRTGLSRKLAEEAARRAESAPRSPPMEPLPTYTVKLAEEAVRRAESAPRSPPMEPLPTYTV